MHAVVVYESLWGNTADIARAIAEGIGPEAHAMPTDQATAETLARADMIIAGAPLLGFNLPTEDILEAIRKNPGSPKSPDLAHPSMRAWLANMPAGHAGCAAFETRIWWSPGSSAKKILAALNAKGYQTAAKNAKFIVTGKYGPLRAGEIDRAHEWGRSLARATW